MSNSAELSNINFSELLKANLSDFSAEDIAKMIKLGNLAEEERNKRKKQKRTEYNNQIVELLRNCNNNDWLLIYDISKNKFLSLDKVEVNKEGFLRIQLC